MAGFRGDVMCSGSELANDPASLTVPVPEKQTARKRRRAFCLTRLKSRNSSDPQQRHPPTANNNMPFMIHCQIGKEIKHICSNCRGAEQLDGESTRFRSWMEARGGGGGRGGRVCTPVVSLLSSVVECSMFANVHHCSQVSPKRCFQLILNQP